MEINLRPLTLGEILDKTAQLYRTNFVLLAGIFAVTNGLVLLLILMVDGVSADYRAIQTTMKLQASAPVVILVCLLVLVGMLLYGASIAAVTRAVAWVYVGEPATIRGAYQSTLPRLGRYLWLMTLAALILLGIALLAALALAVVMVALIAIITVVFGKSGPAATIAGFIVGVSFDLGLFVVLAWFAARYALGIPACVVENLKARKALRRSVELSKSSRGRIFLLFLLVGVIQIGLYVLTQMPFIVYGFMHHHRLSLWINLLSQVISVATNTLVGPILATGLTLFYFDQRVRKEGYDIEWMMAAAGLAGSTARSADGGIAVATVPVDEPLATAPAQPATDALSPGDTL